MTHPDKEQLLDHSFDLLDPAAAEAVAEHLETCESCRDLQAQLARTIAELELLRDDVPVPEALLAQVRQDAAAAARRPGGSARVTRWLWVAAAAAALVLLAVLRDRGEIEDPPGDDGKGVHVVQDIPDKDDYLEAGEPFLPASNIELNVLPRRDNVQITIYNSADLTLVRERRNLTLRKGWNWLQFMWANTLIDPTSLHLQPLDKRGRVEVQQLVFPPRMNGVGRWLLFSKVSGSVPCEITYFTSGIRWRAFYTGTLNRDESAMDLVGYVRVDNASGEDYKDAHTRLLVGKVNLLDKIATLAKRPHAYGRPDSPDRGGSVHYTTAWFNVIPTDSPSMEWAKNSTNGKIKAIKKEGLSEYFLYTIEGTESIPTGWGKRLPSMSAAQVPVTTLYKYDEERWRKRVIRFLSFTNDEEHKLGDTPIPDGSIRVSAEARIVPSVDDPVGPYLTYVGASTFKYIPVGEEVELDLGADTRLQIEPRLMKRSSEAFRFDRDRNVTGWDDVQIWQVQIRNTRDLPVSVEITRKFGSAYWRLKMTDRGVIYEKHDVTHARFTADLRPYSRLTFTYTLRLYNGVRREETTK